MSFLSASILVSDSLACLSSISFLISLSFLLYSSSHSCFTSAWILVILEQQSKTQQEFTEDLDSLRLDSGKSQLTEHIIYLEEQLRKHRLHVEQFQSNFTAVRQMKAQLRELQATVDKKTKDFELFHTTLPSASCSSPSEDVSIRCVSFAVSVLHLRKCY